MKHHANPRFWRAYRGLPEPIQALADRSYALLKANPKHGSLHFKKIGTLWSVRVGLHHRALAAESGNDVVWFWIGSHADYDSLVGHKAAGKSARSPRQASSKRTLKRTTPKPRG